ncbi:hypothetical protein [Paraglaciecola sp.]|uniref:hypothetical protein n=1 Tax=Paraglaciecola sp. TaxID=1920173 RepID=UPI00274027D8|nr:hypothetical protein [Paraglaciecola sp.]MDP5031182.1 hypothetical protein [Paraglaciecola sp.]
MKALFITGSNQYGVLSHFLSEMRADLALLDIETDQLDVANEESIKISSTNLSELKNYSFIVSINGMGLSTSVGGITIDEYSKEHKVYVLLVDHPLHLMTRFIGSNVTVLCIDQEHVGFCQLCQIDAIYFPHAVAESHLSTNNFINFENKSNEIIYPVSYFNIDFYREKLKPVWNQVGSALEQATSITRFLQNISVLPMGSRPATVPLNENIRRISVFADFFIRAKSRLLFLEECEENDLVLTVIGNNSMKYQNAFPTHKYEESVRFDDLKERMRESKFVAHNSPGFELGLHERVVVPLSLGTLPLTPVNFIKKTFGESAVSFQQAKTLTHGEYTERLHMGYNKLSKEHTWRSQWAPLIAEL